MDSKSQLTFHYGKPVVSGRSKSKVRLNITAVLLINGGLLKTLPTLKGILLKVPNFYFQKGKQQSTVRQLSWEGYVRYSSAFLSRKGSAWQESSQDAKKLLLEH